MLRVVLVRCLKCGKVFRRTKGGVIKGINGDCDVCLACRAKQLKSIFRK